MAEKHKLLSKALFFIAILTIMICVLLVIIGSSVQIIYKTDGNTSEIGLDVIYAGIIILLSVFVVLLLLVPLTVDDDQNCYNTIFTKCRKNKQNINNEYQQMAIENIV